MDINIVAFFFFSCYNLSRVKKMTNKKNSKRIKMDKYETEEQVELKQFIKILVVLIILVVGVYFLTRAFVTKDLFNKKEESSETTKGAINYSTTLIGNMFNKIDKEYYVLMYDTEDLQAAYYSGFMSNYSKNKDNDDFINIYFANLNNPLNQKYVTDNEEEMSFAELLENVAKTGIERIRFVTSHPWNFTDDMINTIAKYDNIMPYIHLPLQSGSDRILKLMGRRYTQEEYIKLYKKIKEKVKNAAITTDIIVGFPNESDEDFNETLKVVEKCQYDGAFTFIYSPREGTPAAKMPDSTPLSVKEERLHRLNEIVNKYSNMNNQKYLDKTVKVLLVGESEKDFNKLYGYTETMKLVNVECDKKLIGQIVDVKITEAKSFSLDGYHEK